MNICTLLPQFRLGLKKDGKWITLAENAYLTLHVNHQFKINLTYNKMNEPKRTYQMANTVGIPIQLCCGLKLENH